MTLVQRLGINYGDIIKININLRDSTIGRVITTEEALSLGKRNTDNERFVYIVDSDNMITGWDLLKRTFTYLAKVDGSTIENDNIQFFIGEEE